MRAAFGAWLLTVVRTVALAEEQRGNLFYTRPLPDGSPDPVAVVALPTVATAAAGAEGTQPMDSSDTEDAVPESSTKKAKPIAIGAAAVAAAASAAVAASQSEVTLGLGAQLINVVLSMMELSRTHSRRYNEYFLFIRQFLQLGPVQRTHVACGLFPTFANRPVRAMTLFIDYFMGECSPIYKELPAAQQTRTSLTARVVGERIDLTEYFWTFWELTRSFDTGASLPMTQHPKAVLLHGQPMSMSGTDRLMWARQDMLAALIKQNYNAAAVAEIVPYWCWENVHHTNLLVPLVAEAFMKAFEPASFEDYWKILRALLNLSDSLRPSRVARLLDGSGVDGGVFQYLRQRSMMHSDATARCLVSLSELIEGNEAVLVWLLSNTVKWQWVIDFLTKEEYAAARMTYAGVAGVSVVNVGPVAGTAAVGAGPAQGVVPPAGGWRANPLRQMDTDVSTVEMDEGDKDMYENIPGLVPARVGFDDLDDDDDDDYNRDFQAQRWSGHGGHH